MESSVVSALRRALRYTIGTAIVALVGSNLLPETDAERLATTAYLAVIFAAVTLAALHFVSGGATASKSGLWSLPFPRLCSRWCSSRSSSWSGLLLPGNRELKGSLFLALCRVHRAMAAFGGGGLFRTMHVALAAGGVPAALTRYGVLAGVVALLLAMVLPVEMRAVAVEAACWAVVVAAISLSVSLIGKPASGDS